jgi:phosphohistidine phosphatase
MRAWRPISNGQPWQRRREAALVALELCLSLAQSAPMRRLFLIRHAKAQPSVGRDDYERTLTDRGRADARLVAAALAARNMLPDVLVHSGAARAKGTAEIFADEWARRVKLEEELGLYDATQSLLFARARELSNAHKRVGLVGHNPGLGELAVALTSSGAEPELSRLNAKYPTGAVAVLDFSIRRWEDLERASGMLALYLTPGELEAGAR